MYTVWANILILSICFASIREGKIRMLLVKMLQQIYEIWTKRFFDFQYKITSYL